MMGCGFKVNFFYVETCEEYWISGCKKGGTDALYPTSIEIDDDVRDEYWTNIRRKPQSKGISRLRDIGKYSN